VLDSSFFHLVYLSHEMMLATDPLPEDEDPNASQFITDLQTSESPMFMAAAQNAHNFQKQLSMAKVRLMQ
jgi:hypothetical protein